MRRAGLCACGEPGRYGGFCLTNAEMYDILRT